MDKEKIIDKIAKLMALGKSTNPNEAAIALARAQKLMAEYKITTDDVSLGTITEENQDIPSFFRNRWLYTTLCSCVSSAFGLSCIYQFNGSNILTQVTFVGPQDRVAAASYAFTILVRQASFVKKEFTKDFRAKITPQILMDIFIAHFYGIVSTKNRKALEERFAESTASIDSFKTLLFERIFGPDNHEKLELIEFAKRKINSEIRKHSKMYLQGWLKSVHDKVIEFAISDDEQKLIDSYMTKHYPELTTMKRARHRLYSASEIDAYTNGVRDGQEGVNLFHGVNGTSHAPLALEHK